MMNATTLANDEINLRMHDTTWSALRYFNLYRVVISGLFTVLSFAGKLPPNLPEPDARLFTITASAYVILAVAAQFAIEQRRTHYRYQVYGLVVVDIVAITVLMHAAGGVTSGIGMLLIVSIGGACLLASGRAAVFFAALASFAFLGETVFGTLYLDYSGANYTQAGLLGAACFGTAVLASVLAQRALRSEALAAQRAVDIENLSRLNEHIVRRMRAGIMVLDHKADVLLMNDSAAEILNCDQHAQGAALQTVCAPMHKAYRSWLETRENPDSAIDGVGNVNALVSFTELSASAEAHLGTLVFLEDAAETRQRAQQMKLASLGRLTASIAHEIRNPLGAISHAGQLLSESGDISAEDFRLTEIIAQQTSKMNTIIENILMIGRRKEIVSENFDLRPWLERFTAELSDRYNLGDGDLMLALAQDPILVRIDKTQLHQVLWNLCENALRYATTPPLLRFEADVNELNGRPFLDVADSGPGLDRSLVDEIFEPFATAEAGGTGLGLYIARELCESNQATLQLVKFDDGCSFRVSFAHPGRQQRFGDV